MIYKRRQETILNSQVHAHYKMILLSKAIICVSECSLRGEYVGYCNPVYQNGISYSNNPWC